jgi:carbon-monoxide dehydrogenase large subunit
VTSSVRHYAACAKHHQSIDTSAALKALPGVDRGADRRRPQSRSALHYMPTLAGDVQMQSWRMEKVLFQNQEVAFVIAEDRYIASDAIQNWSTSNTRRCPVSGRSVQVDGSRRTRSCGEDHSRTRWKARTARANTPITSLNGKIGDKEATDKAVFANADVTIKEMLVLITAPIRHRWKPASRVASFDKVKGELTLWGTFQAPHVIRTVVSLISGHSRAQDPCHRTRYRRWLRQQGRRLCWLHVCSIVGVHRSPVFRSNGSKTGWRISPLHPFARDYHMTTEIAATRVTAPMTRP